MSTLVPTVLHPFTREDSHLVAGVIGIAAALAATAVYCALGSKDQEGEFPKLPGIQLYHAWNFFRRRYDFIQSNHERNLGKSFSFDVVHHKFIALTGEEARRIFFSDPHLDASQGVKLFMGSVCVSNLHRQIGQLIPITPRYLRWPMWRWRSKRRNRILLFSTRS